MLSCCSDANRKAGLGNSDSICSLLEQRSRRKAARAAQLPGVQLWPSASALLEDNLSTKPPIWAAGPLEKGHHKYRPASSHPRMAPGEAVCIGSRRAGVSSATKMGKGWI